MNKQITAMMLIALLIIVYGCTNQDGDKKSELALIKVTEPAPLTLDNRPAHQSIGDEVRKVIADIPGIYDHSVIEGKKEIVVAYKVKHLKRFKMQEIEKRVTKILKEKYPKENFIVSSDYKIFLESVRMREDMEQSKLSEQEAEKRFKKIIKLKKELS